jgi:DNA-binding transcriptional LysR family regulator
MELRHLRYFVAVADEQNVTRASAKLHVSQPAVSRQIRDLEDELGVPLLERSAKAVKLTDAGRVFLEEARAVLKRTDAAVAAVRASAAGQRGELHVGYAPSLTVEILPRALRAFQLELPNVRVLLHDLSTKEMLAGLAEDRLHIALTVQPSRSELKGYTFEKLARYPICAALAPTHPLADVDPIPLVRVADEPLIGYSRADFPEYEQGMRKSFAPVNRVPDLSEEHDSVTSLMAAVEAGRGVAIVPSCMACFAGPRLKIVPLTPAPAPLVVGAVCRDACTVPAVRTFIVAARQKA